MTYSGPTETLGTVSVVYKGLKENVSKPFSDVVGVSSGSTRVIAEVLEHIVDVLDLSDRVDCSTVFISKKETGTTSRSKGGTERDFHSYCTVNEVNPVYAPLTVLLLTERGTEPKGSTRDEASSPVVKVRGISSLPSTN